MKNNISPIGEVLKNVFTGFENQKNVSRETIDDGWRSLVGEPGCKHSKPVSIRKTVLTVQVDSSVWMQELSMQKRRILKGLKKTLGKDRISEIHFRIGEF